MADLKEKSCSGYLITSRFSYHYANQKLRLLMKKILDIGKRSMPLNMRCFYTHFNLILYTNCAMTFWGKGLVFG